MLIGLASFSVDDFELAVKYFEAAADRAAIQDDPDFLKEAVEGLLLCYYRIGQAEKVEEIKNKYPEILGPDGMHLDDD